jgi:hypothetical protein
MVMSESGEPPVLLLKSHGNQSHVTTKDGFSTDDEDAGMDMAHRRVAMLSEQLYSIGPFGGSPVYFLALASLSRHDLLRQTPKLRFRRFRTSILTRRIASKPINLCFLWISTLATLFSLAPKCGLACPLQLTPLAHSRRLRRILHIVGNAPFARLNSPACKSANDT